MKPETIALIASFSCFACALDGASPDGTVADGIGEPTAVAAQAHRSGDGVVAYSSSSVGPVLELSRAANSNKYTWTQFSAIRMDLNAKSFTDSDDTGSSVIAIETDNVNHFIWSPYYSEASDQYKAHSNQTGIFWANDDHAKWHSGEKPTNPNELVFVGGGERLASISLGNGNAYFNKIKASEIVVDSSRWADYVFDAEYKLASLDEVESHIREHKHLPGIPSAAEVATSGIALGENQARLLAKIEELTLHAIELNKQNLEQSRRLARLEQRVSKCRTP